MTTVTVTVPTATVPVMDARPRAQIEEMIAEIHARRRKMYEANARKGGKQRNPRASSIGSCDREIAHQCLSAEMRPPVSEWLGERFRRGSELEAVVKRELSELGFEVSQSQMTLDIKDGDGTLLCGAHIDGRLSWHGMNPVWEMKSIHPNHWEQLNSAEDFFSGPEWMKRYPIQLLLYMYATNEEWGILLLDDCLGHWKMIPFHLWDHTELVEKTLRRLRKIVDAIKSGSVDSLEFANSTVCKTCWCFAAGVCQPPMKFDGIQIVAAEDLVDAAETIRRNTEAHRAWEKADRLLREAAQAVGPGDYLLGDVLMKVVKTTTTSYEVPQEIKAAYAVKKEGVRKSYEFLDGQ